MIVEKNEKNNGSNNQDNDDDDLDFKAKSESEVIKVPKCTYANDSKAASIFYLCQCSSEDFYPICQACAEKCHVKHNPALRLEGSYTCLCGKHNHVITKENERRLSEKKIKLQNQCFFSKFMEITPNKGFYQHKRNIYCPVCVEYCLNKSFKDKDLTPVDEESSTCQCEKHYEINVINLNVDLISKPKFHTNLQNFNFNILSKITFSKQMYIDYLVTKIAEYQNNPTHENSKNFFSNFINFKILELFSSFAVRWENKFFHVKNFFVSTPPETLIKLMSFHEPLSMLNQEDIPAFSISKFYFAEYLFNYIVRTNLLKYNNLLNIRTILNMNLYQRFIYIQEIKNYFKFNYFDNDNTLSNEGLFYDLSSAILDLYDTIIKANETFEFMDRILGYVFPTFNRIFKYLIKYNIINDELKSKYFELVLDTINLANEKEEPYHGSVFYIVKSILYTLVYRNDRVCINYIKHEKDPNNNKFVFMTNPESDNICKIFVNVVNKFDRSDDKGRTIIYDFYVRKIFELMIGKNEFYIKNLENLQLLPNSSIQLLTSNEVHLDMRRYIYFPFMSEIVKFCTKLNLANRDYFDYVMDYETYLTQVNDIFKELKQFIYNDINFLPDLSKKYQIFFDKSPLNDMTNDKIVEIQQCVRYTLFFQKIEEFIHIYAEGKKYMKSNNKKRFNAGGIQIDYLKMILHFLYLLVNRNYENLCLLMNFKTNIFINAFFDIEDHLYDFLELISEMLFSNQTSYQFDNYYFFSESMNAILNKVNFEGNDTNKKEVFCN